MRDLLDAPVEDGKQSERGRPRRAGSAELLSSQGSDGDWPERRWTASTWTLHLLVACGLPERHPSTRHLLTDEAPHEVVDAIRDAVVAA
jgi:hypothetical protein